MDSCTVRVMLCLEKVIMFLRMSIFYHRLDYDLSQKRFNLRTLLITTNEIETAVKTCETQLIADN